MAQYSLSIHKKNFLQEFLEIQKDVKGLKYNNYTLD